MYLKMLGRLLVLILCLRRTVCFASSSSPAPRLPLENDDGDDGKKVDPQPTPLRIASLNKYGGSLKYFDLVAEENANDQESKTILSRIQNPRSVVSALGGSFVPALRTTFLPIGFPEKIPRGYFQYCVWSWIQDVSTQLRSVLATQKILEGVGVGREGATALSALFNYLVRDGCGMAANLLFTYAASSRFRTDVKRWRLFADMSVDIGITLEIAATLFPRSFFLPCICLGNMFKALCGVAAGACGGSINLYWAKGTDISDINAKFGAQHTVTGAIGLVFAGLFARSIDRVTTHSMWLMYVFLTSLHLYGNVRCMRLISFDYVNTIRLDMILRDYVRRGDENIAQVPAPQNIAQQEPLWFRIFDLGQIFSRRKKSPSIHFGVAYDEFCKLSGKPVKDLEPEIIKAKLLFQGESKAGEMGNEFGTVNDRYIISTGHKNSKPCVVVSFFSDVSAEQQTKAYVHARLLADTLQAKLEKAGNNIDYKGGQFLGEIEEETKVLLKSLWEKFNRDCIEAGWDLSRSELQSRGYEIEVL